MPRQTIEYETQTPAGGMKRAVKTASIIALSITLLVNGVLIAGAAADRGLGAVVIAWVFNPIANFILACVGMVFYPFVKSRAEGGSMLMYRLSALLGPVVAIGVDMAAIAMMDIHVHMC